MKRNLIWLTVVLAAGIGGYAIGHSADTPFEFTVEVDGTGAHLVAVDGMNWGKASYCGEDPRHFSFVVDENGVRSPEIDRR